MQFCDKLSFLMNIKQTTNKTKIINQLKTLIRKLK